MSDLPDMPEHDAIAALRRHGAVLHTLDDTSRRLAAALLAVTDRAEACDNGDCECSREVVEALMEVGGWEEIDGDGTPASVLADHIRRLDYRIEP